MAADCACHERCIIAGRTALAGLRSEEHTSELQSQSNLVCRLLLEKKKSLPNVVSGESVPLEKPARKDGGIVKRSYSSRPQLVQRTGIPFFLKPWIMVIVGLTAVIP